MFDARGKHGLRYRLAAVGVACFLLGIFVASSRPVAQLAQWKIGTTGTFARVGDRSGNVEYPRPLCDNDIQEIYGGPKLAKAITERFEFHDIAVQKLANFMSRPRLDCQAACREFSCVAKPCIGAEAYSGLIYGWERFDLMGPVAQCPSIVSFGQGDEEKRFCLHRQQLENDPSCVAFSIGGNNKWNFEEDLAKTTKCHIHTFDCTVDGDIPSHLKDRVTFHKLCLGSPEKSNAYMRFANFKQLIAVAAVDHVTLLKMDIEGFEYEALQQHMLPTQIALEFHYVSQYSGVFFHGRDLSPAELYAFFNYLFYRGGYLLGARRDNEGCPHCSEVLLVKALC